MSPHPLNDDVVTIFALTKLPWRSRAYLIIKNCRINVALQHSDKWFNLPRHGWPRCPIFRRRSTKICPLPLVGEWRCSFIYIYIYIVVTSTFITSSQSFKLRLFHKLHMVENHILRITWDIFFATVKNRSTIPPTLSAWSSIKVP
jgi:hypothetical protein